MILQFLGRQEHGAQREFLGASAVTLRLLEPVFQRRREGEAWGEAAPQARWGWDLVLKSRMP